MTKKVLILSGPTHEYLDPVRFIGNASSGKMGCALADEAALRGFEVEFITGPVPQENLPGLDPRHIHAVVGAEDMLSAAQPLFRHADIIIFAAAVADYCPAEKQVEKMAKSDAELVLRLRPTPDIARTLCAGKAAEQIAIGFALQTADGEANAQRKLRDKNLDGIVLNTPATLGAEDGTFSFLPVNSTRFSTWGIISKNKCAQCIFNAINEIADAKC